MAKNIDRLDGDGLMENYYIFSFIHLTDIYSCPGSRSGRVSIILPQQAHHTHTHTHTHTQEVHIFHCTFSPSISYFVSVSNNGKQSFYAENSN